MEINVTSNNNADDKEIVDKNNYEEDDVDKEIYNKEIEAGK